MRIIGHLVRPAGKWCDVVALPDGYAWFYSLDGASTCEVNGAIRWTRAVPTDFLRFTRGAAPLGCLGQALDDTCLQVSEHGVVTDGIAYGQNPVACGLDGTPYVVRNAREYTKNGVPVAMPLTSQGIRDVLPDGAVIFGDATYHGVIGGHPFWQYQTRGAITVGQAGTNVGIGVLNGADYLVIPRPGDPEGVHQAQLPDGTLAVCAWTVNGAELWILDLAAVAVPTPEPPAPVPPKPEPVPMPEPEFNLKAEVAAERAKYPAMLTEDQPAQILNAVALAENQRIGLEEWGLSAKPHGNHVPSPQGVFVAYDILHHRSSMRLFDCLTDDLKGTVTWGETVYHGDPVGRPWVAPIRVGPAPQPTPPAPSPAPPAPPSGLPTLHDWIHVEYPQLVAAYKSRHGGHEPSHEWAAFQTCRRGGVMLAPGEAAWSFAKMLAHELAQ